MSENGESVCYRESHRIQESAKQLEEKYPDASIRG